MPSGKRAGDGLPKVEIATRDDLSRWLEANGDRSGSVWLVLWKKGAGGPHLPYGDIVDELLCWGWIDSLPRKLDADRSMLLASPRKPTSSWSAINKAKVACLEAEGRMREAGLSAVSVARANGAWDALNGVETLALPDDLACALEAVPGASGFFAAFPPSSRRAILEWIGTARTPATRAARVSRTAELAGRNLKANFPEGRNRGPAPRTAE